MKLPFPNFPALDEVSGLTAIIHASSPITYLHSKGDGTSWGLKYSRIPAGEQPKGSQAALMYEQMEQSYDGSGLISVPAGLRTHLFIIACVLFGDVLQAAPGKEEEFAELIRATAGDPEMVETFRQNGVPPNPDAEEWFRAFLHQMAEAIERDAVVQIKRVAEPPYPTDYISTVNAQTYHALRDALARNLFVKTDGTPWPTADISRGVNKGSALLAPIDPKDAATLFPKERDALVQRMWAQRQQLSDLDADTLDALHAHWIKTRNTDGYAAITIDQILEMRRLKPKRDGHGRRGGFERGQREEMRRSVTHVSNVWIRMHQQEVFDKAGKGRRGKRRMEAVESRAMVITDRGGQITLDGYLEVDRFVFRPGRLFERFLQRDGRQVALLSAQALHYDPYRHTWEKRLTRFLSFHWRCIASREPLTQRYRVRTLLETIGVDLVSRRGHCIKDRLECALDERLLRDGIIAAWQYDGWDDSAASGRGWFERWLLAAVVIEAPDAIKNHYAQGGLAQPAAVLTSVPIHTAADLHERLKAERETRGLSQLQVAEQLGMGQGHYSKLERGARPRKALRAQLEKWLEQGADAGGGTAP